MDQGGYLYLICATHNVGASVLVLNDAELKSVPVCVHLGQSLLKAIFLTGIDTDALEGFQLGSNAPLDQILY